LSRHYPDRPLVGVLGVVRRQSRILLVQRAKPPFTGSWGFPGGGQELGETLFEAVARELLEETRLVVEPVAMLTVLDTIVRDDEGRIRTHWALIAILAESPGGEIVLDDEALDYGWFTTSEIVAAGLTTMRSVEAIVAQALSHP
jgi:8-oxo-dGTP diphosphatase